MIESNKLWQSCEFRYALDNQSNEEEIIWDNPTEDDIEYEDNIEYEDDPMCPDEPTIDDNVDHTSELEP